MVSCMHLDDDVMGEPSLEEVFAEPIVRLVMQRDGVRDIDLRKAIDVLKRAYSLPQSAH